MQREFRGHMKVLSAAGEKLCRVSILALNDTVNRNGWRYVNLEQHTNQFKDIPILTAYVSEGDGIGGGHNFDMKKDEAGEEYASFTAADAERIIGWVPGSAEVKVVRRNDANWIQVTGNLWRWYAREVVDKITAHPEGMDVSIETLVTKEHKESDGTEVEEEYTVLGITVLGNGSRPAVKGAGIRKLNAAREAMKDAIAQAEEYQKREQRSGRAVLNDMPGACQTRDGPSPHERPQAPWKGATAQAALGDSQARTVATGKSENILVTVDHLMEEEIFETNMEEQKDNSAEMAEMTEPVTEPVEAAPEVPKANTAIELLQHENEALKTRLQALEAEQARWLQREKRHRCEAAVNTVNDELRELNEPREAADRFDAKLCEELLGRCNAGEFSDMENADGEWSGAEKIRNEVRALCMQAQHEMDKKKVVSRDGSFDTTSGVNENRPSDNFAPEPQPIYAQSENHNLSWSLPAQPDTTHETVADRLRNRGGI